MTTETDKTITRRLNMSAMRKMFTQKKITTQKDHKMICLKMATEMQRNNYKDTQNDCRRLTTTKT